MKKTLILTGAALLACGLVLAYLGQAELNAGSLAIEGDISSLGIVMLVLGVIVAIGGAGLAVAGSLEYRRLEAL
jgi:ABC-type enterochelin transport system permease subunit